MLSWTTSHEQLKERAYGVCVWLTVLGRTLHCGVEDTIGGAILQLGGSEREMGITLKAHP